jgi:penicillin amidase
MTRLLAFLALLGGTASGAAAQRVDARADTLRTSGLQQPVEVLRDRWGVNHIYAKNEHDLFFAQGYLAAKDRTFQFELWRRQATGTLAELLGEREVQRDVGVRLFKYRGDKATELTWYHPRGPAIVDAFVEGVNAFVAATRRDTTLIPLELRLLGARPEPWTWEVVVSRHGGLLGNVTDELSNGRFVAAHGAALLKKLTWYHPGPGEPVVTLDSAVDGAALAAPILDVFNAFRGAVRFRREDLQVAYRGDPAAAARLAALEVAPESAPRPEEIGSNNWVVSPRLSLSGNAIMANDPHRAISVPSLRYYSHLVAPGWDVIGGGEPTIPGISIGHNARGAWGLTIFTVDGEDLYVYRTNPANPSQYRYKGAWKAMTALVEEVPVKGRSPVRATLKYTVHGPVVYEDSARHLAYAVRAAWREAGGAPYLASLRMDQATTWAEFQAACALSNIPGENMVWAGVDGTIGWQAVGIAPVRPNWSGLVPVPGDGRYEWAGFATPAQKPSSVNPAAGFIATANNNLMPPGYPGRNVHAWTWADPYRFARISEVLGSGRKFTVGEMARLQTDYVSIPARTLVPLLAPLTGLNETSERARRMLLDWNFAIDKASPAAGLYEAWHRRLVANVVDVVVPADARADARSAVSTKLLVDWLTSPGADFGPNPLAGRDALVARSLGEAVQELTRSYGADPAGWTWGAYHHVEIAHPMASAVPDALRSRLNVGPWPRSGDANTPGVTGAGANQASGASFRIVVEVGAWDNAIGTNTPGQSGDPASPHYRDLFELWKDDRYFPVKYSRSAVEGVTEARTVLTPAPH